MTCFGPATERDGTRDPGDVAGGDGDERHAESWRGTSKVPRRKSRSRRGVLFIALPAAAYQYQFWVIRSGVWTLVQPYSASPTWVLTSAVASGTIQVAVQVRTVGQTVAENARATVNYLWGTATGVQFTSILPGSPQPQGASVTLAASIRRNRPL